jgi:Ca2+/Na+ antiporter
MNGSSDEIGIAVQMAASAFLVLVMTIIHGAGLMGISRVLHLNADRLEERDFDYRAYLLMGAVGLLIFALHMLEIWVFAAFYLLVGAIGTLEAAIYYSAAAYATLGRTLEDFPSEWRLLGALEALVGFLLIGWSTAFMVNTMDKLRR